MDNWQKEHITQNINHLIENLRLNAYVLTTFVTTGVLEIEDIWSLVRKCDFILNIFGPTVYFNNIIYFNFYALGRGTRSTVKRIL